MISMTYKIDVPLLNLAVGNGTSITLPEILRLWDKACLLIFFADHRYRKNIFGFYSSKDVDILPIM